jgi:RAM signalling pathway protein
LPPELVKLTSLKVLSVQKNRIEALPLCLADMASLQVLKLDGNPVRFPPKEILQPQASSPPNGGLQENEIDEIAVTSQIKKFLRQKAISDRSETESGGEESSEGTETPRPTKRVMSGRFPIKVNGTEVPDLRSPAIPRPPPIPSRSHYRGLSQQNAALRRPGVMPLTINNANERLRSNSESLLQANRDRSADRSRRMGIVSKKSAELDTVEEVKSNRYSHYRGLSHGSAMQAGTNGTNGTNGTVSSRSPASPADSAAQRATYVRRLSSLPERKRESLSPDPVVEAAKGILYALFQVHPLINNLLSVARDGTNKRTSLERVFYNATTHVEELDRHIQNYITYSEEDEEVSPRSNENVRRATLTCVGAYMHVCGLLSRNVETLLENGDPRYIRTLLLLVYGTTAEVRNAGESVFVGGKSTRVLDAIEENKKFQARDKSITPTRERPGTASRIRSATVVQHPSTLRVATDVPPPFMNGALRSATMTSATPRSGESFASSASSKIGGDFTEEDRIFEKIFLRLQQSSEMAIKTLPSVSSHFFTAMKINNSQSIPDLPKQFWQVLIQKCSISLQNAESLKARLSLIKLKEPGIRTQGAFWELCNAFIHVS